jgi:3-hydroxyacyl-[acyl-carrier-protein] dehydratase
MSAVTHEHPGNGLRTGGRLDSDEVGRLLPHRHPILLLDRVLKLDPPKHAVGLKNVTIAEPWFAGHFPGRAILPGVLLTECLAQLAGVLVAMTESPAPGPADTAETEGTGVLAEIKRFRFRHLILPGDQVRLEVTLSNRLGKAHEFTCQALVAGTRVAHGTLIIVA